MVPMSMLDDARDQRKWWSLKNKLVDLERLFGTLGIAQS